jgi:hypothetical protein
VATSATTGSVGTRRVEIELAVGGGTPSLDEYAKDVASVAEGAQADIVRKEADANGFVVAVRYEQTRWRVYVERRVGENSIECKATWHGEHVDNATSDAAGAALTKMCASLAVTAL